ncbi:hypothetical protein FBULB1_2192 [Fusarium bulbicola]|nr:hypothetical protein FBULB1_2192 [Fusarium bulbicola]
MTSPYERMQGDNVRGYSAQVSGQTKKDAMHRFVKRYRKRVQEFLNMIEPEPEANLAQKLQTSVAESDRSIISYPSATPEAVPPEQELTDISTCDCSVVQQHLRLAFEWLTLDPSASAVIVKRARPQYVDDDEAGGQHSAKRRKPFHGGLSHCLSKGRVILLPYGVKNSLFAACNQTSSRIAQKRLAQQIE